MTQHNAAFNDQPVPLAVLIDADNISPSSVDAIFRQVNQLGSPIVRRAYGMVSCFSGNGGWTAVQRTFGLVARPQVSNVPHKNVADIALVIDAMQLLYRSTCEGICIVSSDSDFTALAAIIREEGKSVYGFGDAKTPTSFQTACTKFFKLSSPRPAPQPPASASASPSPAAAPAQICPRCGIPLVDSRTRSKQPCKVCPTCNGMYLRTSAMKDVFAPESISAILEQARKHEQPGCVCPGCGSSMSILKVTTGTQRIEIDVCDKCKAIWYDEREYETLVPNDGALLPTISAGKSFRRDLVLTLTADLREGRVKPTDIWALQTILKKRYYVPKPDIEPIIGTLRAQKVIAIQNGSGSLDILPMIPFSGSEKR